MRVAITQFDQLGHVLQSCTTSVDRADGDVAETFRRISAAVSHMWLNAAVIAEATYSHIAKPLIFEKPGT